MRKLSPLNSDVNRRAWVQNHTAESTVMVVPLLDWPGKITGMSTKEESLNVMGPQLAAFEESLTPVMESKQHIFLEKIFAFNDTNEQGEPVVTDVKYLPTGSRPKSVYDLNQITVYADVIFQAYKGIENLKQQVLNSASDHNVLCFRVWVCGRYKNQVMYDTFKRNENPYMGKTMNELLKMLEGTWSWDEIKVEDVHMGMRWGTRPSMNSPTTVLPMFDSKEYNHCLKTLNIEIKHSGDMRSFVEKAIETKDVFDKMHTYKARENGRWGTKNDVDVTDIYYRFFNKVMKLSNAVQRSKDEETRQRYVDELEQTFTEWEAQAL